MLTSRRGAGLAIRAAKAEFLIGALIAASLGLTSAQAATFGHSRIVSSLGQPLHVEIPVTRLTDPEVGSLRVMPAPAQAWRDAGMTPPVALESMRLVLLDGYRPDVKVIQLRSEQVFDRPIVDVLLDIRSVSGQQRYQVSLLAHADHSAVQRAGSENARRPRALDGRTAGAPGGDHATAGARIRVRSGDNMFAIAERNAVQGVTVYQLMMALQSANSRAYIHDNVNLVKAGATLVMPDMDALTALSDREARRLFIQHVRAYARLRPGGGGAEVAALVAAAEAGLVSDGTAPVAAEQAPSADRRDRLRLSGAGQPSSATGQVAGGASAQVAGLSAPGLVNGAASAGQRNPVGVNLLASSGAIASDAVSDKSPDALGADFSGSQFGALGSAATGGGTAVNPDPKGGTDPDDEAALRKGVDESRTRILELEDNVRHLNEALQKQGHVAAEAALEGARSVTEVLRDAIGLGAGAAVGEAGGPATVGGSATPSGSGTSGGTGAAGSSGTGAQGGAAADVGAPSHRAAVAGSTASPGGAPEAGSSAAAGREAAGGNASGSASSSAGSTGRSADGSQVQAGPVGAAGSAGAMGARAGAGTAATGGAGSGAGTTAESTQPGSRGSAGAAGNANSGAVDGPSSSSVKAESEVSWLQENLFAVIGAGLVLVVLFIVWLLRRAAAARRDAFESDSPITDTMVQDRLREIDLDLDRPSSDTRRR